MPLTELGYRLLNALYEKIFKEKMSREALKFLTSTSHVGIGTLLGALLTMAFNILAARIFGPSNFGNLGLVMTLGPILALSMQLGVTPTVKYGAEAHDRTSRISIISTSYLQITLFVLVSSGVFALIAPQLSRLLGVSVELVFFSLLVAVTSTFYALTTLTLTALFKMRAFALMTGAQSVILLVAFLAFIWAGMTYWESAAYSWSISYAAVSLVLIVYLKDYLKPRFQRSWSRILLHYAFLALPGAIACELMGVDRILINRFTTAANVGIYNAYFLPSILVAVMLWSIVNAAFFPHASRSVDKRAILHNFLKTVPYFAVSLVPLFLVLQRIAFIFYGEQYPFNWQIALLFSIAATADFFYLGLSSNMAAEGTRGARINTFSSFVAIAILIGFDVVLIPLVGILGAVSGLIFAYLMAAVYLISRRGALDGQAHPETG